MKCYFLLYGQRNRETAPLATLTISSSIESGLLRLTFTRNHDEHAAHRRVSYLKLRRHGRVLRDVFDSLALTSLAGDDALVNSRLSSDPPRCPLRTSNGPIPPLSQCPSRILNGFVVLGDSVWSTISSPAPRSLEIDSGAVSTPCVHGDASSVSGACAILSSSLRARVGEVFVSQGVWRHSTPSAPCTPMPRCLRMCLFLCSVA